MKIEITKKHIRKGEQCSGLRCPIALAIKEATGAHYVAVLPTEIKIDHRTHDIDEGIRYWIREFDNNKKPGEFTIQIDEWDHRISTVYNVLN